MILSLAPQPVFTHQRHHHEQQQQRGQLRGRLEIEKTEPGLVDGRGEGVVVEHRHRTEIRQCLHQRQ